MAEWIRVGRVDDCPPGKILGVAQGAHRVVVVNAEGEFHALKDQCSHQDLPLSDGDLDGFTLECCYHGAQFDVRSGKALCLPAIRAVPCYPVEVRDRDIYVQVG
ncbi:MAG: non-heme iron oxygenase ferredoxin subunit [Gemmatimonadota bacterium]